MAARPHPLFKIPLPRETRDWLAVKAKQNCRSVGSEILYRLECSRMSDLASTGSAGEPAAGEPAKT